MCMLLGMSKQLVYSFPGFYNKETIVLIGNAKKCLCVAYKNLRASLEEFFKIKDVSEEKVEGEEDPVIQNYGIDEGYEGKVENDDD